MKTCSKCGIEKEDADYYNHAAQCRLCSKEYAKAYRKKNQESASLYRKDYYNSNKESCKSACKVWHDANKDLVRKMQNKSIRKPISRFKTSKKTAIKRNKNWSITMEEYFSIISQECYYCNGYFGKVEVGIGLDRLDNIKGYELSNVVSCCYPCNKIKTDILSPEEAKAAIQLIISMRNNL